ncbi:MAG: FAD binding domain-containing protein, partial [Acidobacteriota bacterium]
MRPFTYSRATSVADAVAAVAAGATPIAGTTEVINWMRLGIHDASRLVDLSDLESFRGIRDVPGGVWIGALSTLAEVE